MKTTEEITPCEPSGWRERHHQLWTAMQTAHEDYRRASHLVRILASDGSDLAPREPGAVNLEMVKDKQRDAFEAYIDTRLRFSEFSTQLTRGVEAVTSQHRFNTVWVQLAVTAALLGSAVIHLFSNHRELTYLNTERSELAAELKQARTNIDALSERLKTLQGNQPAVHYRHPGPATVSSRPGSSPSTRKLMVNRASKSRADSGLALRGPLRATVGPHQFSPTGSF